ncbi:MULTISPECIES: helix-turn-helix domain-containing protein [Burkholderia]|uniref:helix-turn-helix domain-containing protein n=1 Tax=Burkholderia TaxID=32008 RepID=UPI000B7ACA88|nr:MULTISPECIES: helix-turn-helix domain-containing protein [Burkholderia]MBY4725724.1 helix-turn-helix domain-containing protein [Burkholderia contaminans]MCI3969262.1 helix-turn-helix domain-containing protein [Burkholderia sp. HI4860]OXI98496.1 hypothetical protein CFB48_24160 [Burkholderia sp. AU33647]
MSKPFKKKSGVEKVQQYLESGRSITALEALSNFGLFRLASAIGVLRKRGLNIETDTKQDPNGKTYARYTLVKVVNDAPEAKAEEAPKRELKAGDEVVVNDTYGSSGAAVFKGRKGVITRISKAHISWPIAAKFEGRMGDDYFTASELDLVEPVKELKVGARVRSLHPMEGRLEGTVTRTDYPCAGYPIEVKQDRGPLGIYRAAELEVL